MVVEPVEAEIRCEMARQGVWDSLQDKLHVYWTSDEAKVGCRLYIVYRTQSSHFVPGDGVDKDLCRCNALYVWSRVSKHDPGTL